jgi:hypothetical protein
MNRPISHLCLFSLCGLGAFGPATETELRAVELYAREEAGVSWRTEFKLLDMSASTARPGQTWQGIVQDHVVLGVPAESGAAGGLGQKMRITFVPLETYFPPLSIFRLIPTHWGEVLMPIPTTWDAKIILIRDGWEIGYPLKGGSQHGQVSQSAPRIGVTQW